LVSVVKSPHHFYLESAASQFIPVAKVMLTSAVAKAASSAEELLEVIDRKSLLDPLDNTGERPESIQGEIELTGIHFAYPSSS
jgi:ABC-type multidrug transport system fused ATPase/permease subunit